jgi:hypothetical protein
MSAMRGFLIGAIFLVGSVPSCKEREVRRAEVDVARAQIKNLKIAVQRHRWKHNVYPTSLDEVATYLEDGKIPTDPWGGPFIYDVIGDGFRIYSKGPDRTAGTDDDVK